MNNINRFVFEYANSNMFVTICGHSALIIDPNISEKALEHLKNNSVSEITILLTHEHYDHTSGLTWLCQKFKSTVICHEETALSLMTGKNSRPIIVASSHINKLPRDEIREIVDDLPKNYKYEPDITFSTEYKFKWQDHLIRMISTPGHSPGSCCIELDNCAVATGDSLILNTPVITRFCGGSAAQYEAITLPYLKTINSETLILPGHGDIFYMKEFLDNQKN